MLASERLLASLAPAIGKHRAQSLLQEALADGRRRGLGLEAAVAASDDLRPHLGDAGPVLPAVVDVGASGAMVDEVLERARQARTQERATWP